MALADDVEFYGRAVEAGEMDRDTAVSLLHQANPGSFTDAGARDVLSKWRTTRARYTENFDAAWYTLRSIENGRRPHPSARQMRRFHS